MWKVFIWIAAFACTGIGQLQAQEDSTQYIFGLPVSEDDTAEQLLQRDQTPRSELTPLDSNSLPRKVLRALNKEAQYKAWRDSTVYFDNNTGLYIVPIRTPDGVKIFGLNEDGNPVTFDEVSPARIDH